MPAIPKGFATRLGQIGVLVFLAIGVVIYVFDLNVNWEALVAAGFAAVTAWTTIFGRMMQATALYRDVPPPVEILEGDLDDEDPEDMEPPYVEPPVEEELVSEFPEDAPEDPPPPEGAVGGKPGMEDR